MTSARTRPSRRSATGASPILATSSSSRRDWSSNIACPASSTTYTPETPPGRLPRQCGRYPPSAVGGLCRGNAIAVTGNDFDRVDEEIYLALCPVHLERRAGRTAGEHHRRRPLRAHRRRCRSAASRSRSRLEWRSDNDFSRIVSDNIITVSRSGEYDNVLPAIDFRIEPMDNVVARASYSRTMARADYGNLFVSRRRQRAEPADRHRRRRRPATRGNPALLPLVSDNLDIALEWYFAPSSFVTATFFNKDVKNFVGVGQFQRNLFGLRDPSSGLPGTRSGTARQELLDLGLDITDVNLFTMTALLIQNGWRHQCRIDRVPGQPRRRRRSTRPSSTRCWHRSTSGVMRPIRCSSSRWRSRSTTEDANIHGVELAGQYFFGDSGFGIAGSYTFVDGDVGIDIGADPNENTFALVGLSDTANLTLIYENYGISARVTYNWRDKFLVATNRQASRNPVFVEPFATLDLNVSYDINEQIAVSFEAREPDRRADPDLRARREQSLVRPGAEPAILPGRTLQVLEPGRGQKGRRSMRTVTGPHAPRAFRPATSRLEAARLRRRGLCSIMGAPILQQGRTAPNDQPRPS